MGTSRLAPERPRNHGMSYTLTYCSWQRMRERCLRSYYPEYRLYGGRGIRIDPRWDDFMVFLADVGERPSKAHTLDRWPDQNGNYVPGNVRWADKKQQARNKRCNVIIEFEGQRLLLAEWAERSGINYHTLYGRLQKGMSFGEALRSPVREDRRGKLVTFRGESKTLTEWARGIGSSLTCIRQRLAHGLSVEEALTRPVRRRVERA